MSFLMLKKKIKISNIWMGKLQILRFANLFTYSKILTSQLGNIAEHFSKLNKLLQPSLSYLQIFSIYFSYPLFPWPLSRSSKFLNSTQSAFPLCSRQIWPIAFLRLEPDDYLLSSNVKLGYVRRNQKLLGFYWEILRIEENEQIDTADPILKRGKWPAVQQKKNNRLVRWKIKKESLVKGGRGAREKKLHDLYKMEIIPMLYNKINLQKKSLDRNNLYNFDQVREQLSTVGKLNFKGNLDKFEFYRHLRISFPFLKSLCISCSPHLYSIHDIIILSLFLWAISIPTTQDFKIQIVCKVYTIKSNYFYCMQIGLQHILIFLPSALLILNFSYGISARQQVDICLYMQFSYKNNHQTNMISNQLLQHVCQIRRTDQSLHLYLPPSSDYDNCQYFDQLQLLLEVKKNYVRLVSLHYPFIFIIQQAQRLGFKNTTKFLAKKYFDVFSAKHPTFTQQHAILVIITCLRCAAKFNETAEVSQSLTMEFWIIQSGRTYQKQAFVQCEIQLIKTLNFKMRFTSPYQYLVVKCLLPHLKQAMAILNSTIDFALSLPELRAASAQGIFFGALIYCCKQKNQPIISFNIIHAITYKWEQSQEIARILESNLNRILQQ